MSVFRLEGPTEYDLFVLLEDGTIKNIIRDFESIRDVDGTLKSIDVFVENKDFKL